MPKVHSILSRITNRGLVSVEQLADDWKVYTTIAAEPTTRRGVELRRPDDDEPQAMGWDEDVTAGVVEGALLAAMQATHSQAVRLVEEGGGLVVLAFAVLHHEAMTWPVGVNRQPDFSTGPAWIAE